MEEIGFVSGESKDEGENHHNDEPMHSTNNNHEETKPIDDQNLAEVRRKRANSVLERSERVCLGVERSNSRIT